MNPRVLLRGLILLVSLVAVGFILQNMSLDKAWVDTEVRGRGLYGEFIFMAAGVVFTGFGLPRQIISFLGGYAFGFVYGTVFSLVAMVGGCILAFYYARLLGRDLVVSRFPNRVKGIDSFLHDNPLSMTLLIRLLPVGSNFVVNLAAGVSGVRAILFFIGSAIGYIPQAMVFTLVGSGIDIDPELRISLSVILFVLSGVIGVYLYRKHRHGKTFDNRVEVQIGGSE